MVQGVLDRRDPEWQRLFADAEWKFLAEEWGRSSRQWVDRQRLVQRMSTLIMAYSPLHGERIDTIAKLSDWIEQELNSPWLERISRDQNIAATDLLRPKADRAREIAAQIRDEKPLLPALPQRVDDPRGDLLAVRDWCGAALHNHTPAETPTECTYVLHRDDLRILWALAEAKTTVLQYELEKDPRVGLSRRTICERLKRLRAAGFINRPNGERGGEAITALGRARIRP